MKQKEPKKKAAKSLPQLTDEQMLEAFRKKRMRKRYMRRGIVITVLAIALITSVLLSPLFHVRDIYVEGINYVTRDEVLAAGGLSTGRNTFLMNMGLIRRRIAALPYVDYVSVRRVLPFYVEVDVTECVPVACVLYLDSKIVIDAKGKVLEVKGTDDEVAAAGVTGVDVTELTPGQPLGTNDAEKLRRLLSLLQELQGFSLLDRLYTIDVTDMNTITMHVGPVDVVVGDDSQLNYKMKYLRAILDTLRDDEKGRIDLTTIPNVVFKAYVTPESAE